MSRREEEGGQTVSKISASVITGYFISVDVPQVLPGEDVKATIDFYAINPGALYWATFLVVDSYGLGLKKLLDKAREIGQEGHREKTYNLGPMPDKNIAISFFLFAHDDAAYDWNWSEYTVWLAGYSVEVSHLDTEIVILSPSKGTIIKMELEYNESRQAIPATLVPLGERGLVHIWGRNDTSQRHPMGISWVVYTPSGNKIEEYSDWEFWATSPGESHHFIGGRRPLDEEGEYRIDVCLYMNPENPMMVDRYQGKLCTVAFVEPPPPKCEIDEDCPEGYVCVNGVCIPEEVPPDEVPPEKISWWPIVLAGGGILAIIGLAKKKKH